MFVLDYFANTWSLGPVPLLFSVCYRRSTPTSSRSFKPSLRVSSSPSSATLGQDLPWTRLNNRNVFKPPASTFVPLSRLRPFNTKVYSPLPPSALSLPQPARQLQVSHCCCARTPPLNNRLHLSWKCLALLRVCPASTESFPRRFSTTFTIVERPVTPTDTRPRTYALSSATSTTSP